MNHWQKSLINGVLSGAISVTVLLTVADDDGQWGRTDVAGAAGLAAFCSGVVASVAARSPAVEAGLASQF
ncbi:hypothetical protein [Haloarcula salinisoli]|uniref:Uncharacterized protein n=1 Tax=Haloarcula salinisoli TaxID=2487746 RepID=A0A8J7YA56_9EURY|nr:hypothetical protein [Halomicroarcula salinisoli]MBX0302280.1 hypothetical protein [Halomicroarcula salinisoli]